MSQYDFVAPFCIKEQSSGDYKNFRTLPLNGALGAEINGLDLSKKLTDDLVKEIEGALHRHLVLVFRDQDLSPQQLANVGKKFGDLHTNPYAKGVDGVPEVMEVRSSENDELRFTGLWHSDISWGSTPSLGSLLYAVDIPPHGGDTLFSNMYTAYESLSTKYQDMLASFKAIHRVDVHKNYDSKYAQTDEIPVVHPVVRTHPETKKKLLFVNEYFTDCFEGMTRDESKPILDYLYRHLSRADFSVRIRWQPGTLVFWDNRCTQHYATNDYKGTPRLMHRVTVNGDVPY